MDLVEIASLSIPYLIKAAEAFAAESGKRAWDKISELKGLVKEKFERDNEAKTALEEAKKDPNGARLASLKEALVRKMREDQDFADNLAELLKVLQNSNEVEKNFVAVGRSVVAEKIVGSIISTGDNYRNPSDSSAEN